MLTVAQQMSPEERRERLLAGLKASPSDQVVINFSQLAHAVGMDNAEKLILNLTSLDRLVTSRYSRQPRLVSTPNMEVDRLAAIEMIERVKGQTNKAKIDKLVKGKK